VPGRAGDHRIEEAARRIPVLDLGCLQSLRINTERLGDGTVLVRFRWGTGG
jgi:hypothetical protein